MTITASQTNTRQAPRKLRLVANAVRKLSLTQALRQLAVMERRSSIVVLKTLRQAIANAQHNHGARFEDLVLKNITIDGGSQFKRFRAVSRGRGHGILKKTSHVTVELEHVQAGELVAQSAEKAPKTTKSTVVEAEKSEKTAKTAKTETKKSVAKSKPVAKKTTTKK